MIKLPKPNMDVANIIEDCISNVRTEPILSHVRASTTTIIEKCVEYDELAEQGRLGELCCHSIILGGATKDDMTWLYENKFVADGGRKYYDKIKAIPPFGRCPYCGVRRIKPIDHYLPKSQYPAYAINPNNLIAVCSDCNTEKSAEVAGRREYEFMHPYYDDFDDEIWLKVRVLFNEDIVFQYYVDFPCGWNREKYERAKYHFHKLKLDKLYIEHCGEEFSEYKHSAKRLYNSGGIEVVRRDLEERIVERRSETKNNWRAALYSGLLDEIEAFGNYLGGF